MAKKKKNNYSGIGGQAVIEGIMMRNKDKYSLACRKPDGEIALTVNDIPESKSGKIIRKIPLVRGIFIFFDSLSMGMDTLSASAQYYDDEEEETWLDRALSKIFGKNAEKVIMGFTMVLSLILAVGIFIVLPYYVSAFIGKFIFYDALIAVIEGVLRLTIFILYLVLISLIKDMRRVFMYHGAEHKCINCIERGMPLNVRNVMHSSRKHRRCGTSFLVLVMVITIILFFFIRVDSTILKVGLRLLMIPVIAGISYEFLRLAGKYDNIITRIISAPGMLLQNLTTREPDEKMAEVAIAAVEAVFDWKQYLRENYNYKFDGDDEETVEEGKEPALKEQEPEGKESEETGVESGEKVEEKKEKKASRAGKKKAVKEKLEAEMPEEEIEKQSDEKAEEEAIPQADEKPDEEVVNEAEESAGTTGEATEPKEETDSDEV